MIDIDRATLIQQHLQSQINIEEPRLYEVIIFNDDITPMDFVVELIMKVFGRSNLEANLLMMAVHHTGQKVVGIYTFDIAQTKRHIGQKMAKDAGYPLRLGIRPTS